MDIITVIQLQQLQPNNLEQQEFCTKLDLTSAGNSTTVNRLLYHTIQLVLFMFEFAFLRNGWGSRLVVVVA